MFRILFGILLSLSAAVGSSVSAAEPMARFLPGQQLPSTGSDAAALLAEFRQNWDESKWEKNFRGIMYMRKTGADDWKNRMTTLRSLVLLGKESIPTLTKALDSDHAPTRVLAAQALSYLGPQAEIDRLKAMIENDTSAAARLYAVDAIGTSGKSESVDWETLAMSQRNRDVRKHMSYAMQREGNAISEDVITALTKWNPAAIDSAKVGSLAPDFQLNTIAGKPISLSDYRGKQAVVLVFIYGDT